MGGSDFSLDGSRIGEDGAASVAWSEACNINVANWNEGNQLVVSATVTSASHTPATESFKIRWRVSGGNYADISDAGVLQNGISAGALSNATTVNTASGCQTNTVDASEECENESPHQTGSLTCTQNDAIEIQSCIDMSGAAYSTTYEFEIYSATESVSIGDLVTVTIRADPAGPTPEEGTQKLINRQINVQINERMN